MSNKLVNTTNNSRTSNTRHDFLSELKERISNPMLSPLPGKNHHSNNLVNNHVSGENIIQCSVDNGISSKPSPAQDPVIVEISHSPYPGLLNDPKKPGKIDEEIISRRTTIPIKLLFPNLNLNKAS